MNTENLRYVQWIAKFCDFSCLEFGSLCLGALYHFNISVLGVVVRGVKKVNVKTEQTLSTLWRRN